MPQTEIFDKMYGMSAVRFGDGSCGVVDAAGRTVWTAAGCVDMRFMSNHFVVMTYDDGKKRYLDLRNLMVYGTRPAVRRYGHFELLKAGGRYYSRTKDVYVSNRNIRGKDICDMGFYITIPDSFTPIQYNSTGRSAGVTTHGYACLLSGDDSGFYRINRRLADGTIIVYDKDMNYYHVTCNGRKYAVGHAGALEEGGVCRAEIERITAQAKERRRRQDAEKERRIRRMLESLTDVRPFKSGMKWGLKTDDRIVIPPIYRSVKNPVGMFCAVEAGCCRWGVISLDGKTVIEPQYQDVEIRDTTTAMLTRVTGQKVIVKLY